MTDDPKTKIREQNDAFRKREPGIPGQILFTQGIQALVANSPNGSPEGLMAAIADFDDFTTDNDPQGEHDFGSLTYDGERLFWKIDLYDEDYLYGSEAPDDIARTRRVLTIMLPSEY